MTDDKPQRPHLVAVGDPPEEDATEANFDSHEGSEGDEEAGERNEGGEPSRGLLFWLLFVAAVASIVGLAIQTQRAGELQASNAKLAGELFTARSALDAYETRFDEVRTSVGGLQAEIEQLNALVSADPLAPQASPGAAAVPASDPPEALPAD